MNKKQIASENDTRLLHVALYHETKGMRIKLKDPEHLMNRFSDFKGMVMRGECSLEQLENKVFEQNGIITESESGSVSVEKFRSSLEEIYKELKKRNE